MSKDVEIDSFKSKCEQLELELLSVEVIDGRVLVGCNLHGGAWSASLSELTLKHKLSNCSLCFSRWIKKSTSSG